MTPAETDSSTDTVATVTNELDVLNCPLDGIRLIEASAGTGKTWNICGLYLRLLLQRKLEVQRILVVTFTNAATAELRERIRQRLLDTLRHVQSIQDDPQEQESEKSSADTLIAPLVQTLLTVHGQSKADLIARLELALATFDEASIFTIHGFCQRALADTPFLTAMPLSMELLQDDSELLAQSANDFWRRRLGGSHLSQLMASCLLRHKDSPEKFAKFLKRQTAKPLMEARWPNGTQNAPIPQTTALSADLDAARSVWLQERENILSLLNTNLSQLNAGSYKPDVLLDAAAEWDTIFSQPDVEGVLDQPQGKSSLLTVFRLRKGTKRNCHTPEHPFFTLAQAVYDEWNAVLKGLDLARMALLRDLLDEAGKALREAKRRQRVIAFDDMLFNLYERLCGGESPWLAGALRTRFAAALVDEFQDTDPLQFAVFKTIYANSDAPLFFVGDPKQAIYSFRNADLYTYLEARAQARGTYSLAANQRSTPQLIGALNRLFGCNSRAFMIDGLHYQPVVAGSKPRKVLLDVSQPGPVAALQLWALPEQPEALKTTLQPWVARATAAEIARLLDAARKGQITLDQRPLQAGDIAVLVRTHAEGSRMRSALSELQIGCIELSRNSIYQSTDAEELEILLTAILEPSRHKRLIAAWATELMGADAAAVEALAGDESALLDAVQTLTELRQRWLQQGIGVMLANWLRSEKVSQRMLARPDGERRMTNILHLLECLHQAEAEHRAPDSLLHWLRQQRAENSKDDAVQLRLESDQNLVQIVTIHRAKGLEYPIVFCPFLWNGRLSSFSDNLDGTETHDAQNKSILDLRKDFEDDSGPSFPSFPSDPSVPSDRFDEKAIKAQRKRDQSAEFLRLVYVALTRAVHRCYLTAGCYLIKGKKSSSATESMHSLLNWLVAGNGCEPADWFDNNLSPETISAEWRGLANSYPDGIALSSLPGLTGLTGLTDAAYPDESPSQSQVEGVQPALSALKPPQHVPSGWWLGSYSGLAKGARAESAAPDHDLYLDEPKDAEPLTPDLPANDILRFSRGPLAGECLHAIFEQIDFCAPETWEPVVNSELQLILPATEAARVAPAAPTATEQHAANCAMVLQMLHDVLNTPLPTPALRLGDVTLARRVEEMEFHLPADNLQPYALNALLQRWDYPTPVLDFTALRGFLKGYIDLVFEHQGQYFVLDWKSNFLGLTPQDYGAAGIDQAMNEHAYHLQYLLYSVALHRYLQQRLPDYQYEQHFGGVYYLFVRGVRGVRGVNGVNKVVGASEMVASGWFNDDGTPCGVYFHKPPQAVIEELSILITPPEAHS